MSRFFKLTNHVFKNKSPKKLLTKEGDSLKAIILDFSGTICDPYVIAPAKAFVKSFQLAGIEVTMEEARKPMGMRKDLHIQEMLQEQRIKDLWYQKHQREPTIEDGLEIYKKHFIRAQNECIRDYCNLIPGTAEVIQNLQNNYQIKVGSTTGFTKIHQDIILEETKKQGYQPDFAVAGDDIEFNMGSRPAPYMIYKNMMKFGIIDKKVVMKVDDTNGGVQEGLNAGVWSVGLYQYSNYMNIDSIDQWNNMTEKEKIQRAENSLRMLKLSGAHYIARDINDLPDIINDINKRLAQGESP